jgi:hypothetical protein
MAQELRRKGMASLMAAVMASTVMAPAMWSPVFAAETASPSQKVARAAPQAKATDPTEKVEQSTADAESFPATVKKQVASVGMLLLLLAAAPGNVARKVDHAIQNTDFGKKQAADKAERAAAAAEKNAVKP